MKFEFKSLFDLQFAFSDEQSSIDHLEIMIWGNVIVSPFDATSKVYKCKGNKYRCKIQRNISMSKLVLFLITL